MPLPPSLASLLSHSPPSPFSLRIRSPLLSPSPYFPKLSQYCKNRGSRSLWLENYTPSVSVVVTFAQVFLKSRTHFSLSFQNYVGATSKTYSLVVGCSNITEVCNPCANPAFRQTKHRRCRLRFAIPVPALPASLRVTHTLRLLWVTDGCTAPLTFLRTTYDS